MIGQLYPWTCAFVKRILYQKRIVLLFLLFPIVCIGIRIYCLEHESLMQVALYQEGTSSLASETIQQLTRTEGIVSFYEADSKQSLYRAVKNSSAQCGYIFTEKYQTDSLLDSQKWKHSVQVVQSPGSNLTGSINELVFSVFFKHYNKQLLHDYLSQDRILKKNQDVEAMLADADALFEKHCNDNSTFSFSESNADILSDTATIQSESNQLVDIFLTNACRGILSVILLLCALCGGIFLGKDQRKILVMPMRPLLRTFVQLADIATPIAMMATAGFIGMLILPAHQSLLMELGGLILYCILLTMFVLLIRLLIQSELAFCVLTPLLTLCSLILSPVFIDLSTYQKLLSIPKYLLPGTYYLEAVTKGGTAFFKILAGILLTSIFSFALMRIRTKKHL